MSLRIPIASIGLPVYNGEKHLQFALDSILSQTLTDFEVIISDNGSNDGTQDICQSYANMDDRITYHRLSENMGAAYNYNRVFELSSGQYFKWAAHDDIILPTFLSRCVEEFELAQRLPAKPAIVYPKSNFIDDEGRVLKPDVPRINTKSSWVAARAFHAIQQMNMATPVFGLFSSAILRQTRLIDSFISSDFVLLFEAALLGSVIQFDDMLFLRRIHPDMSRLANRTDEEVIKWFDPKAEQRMPRRRRLFVEYQKSIWEQVPMGTGNRLMCSLALRTGAWLRSFRDLQGYYRRKWLKSIVSLLARDRPTN